MKKAKIMLGAIVLFSIVGGNLAFKAKKFNSFSLYYSTIHGGHCTSTTNLRITVLDPGQGLGSYQTNQYATTYTQTCPTLTFYTTE